MNSAQVADASDAQEVPTLPPAIVISLDFELHWGVRDHVPLDRTERARLLVARSLVPRILALFQEFAVHATWAVVGILFARSREHVERFRPAQDPGYTYTCLNPYRQQLGKNEDDDPFHFAPSLVEEIAGSEGQEIASHSFSHYYSMERGQTVEGFEADLRSAVAIAADSGHRLVSYVFPRNEVNAAYLPVLTRCGFKAYRDTESISIKRSASFAEQQQLFRRAGRLLDSYVNLFGDQTSEWPKTKGLARIPASRYLRPYRSEFRLMESLLMERIRSQMKTAGEQRRIFHLWWHPEDFASNPEGNLRTLRRVLTSLQEFKERYGMVSLSMSETLDYPCKFDKKVAST